MNANIFKKPLSYDNDFMDNGEIGRGNFGIVNKVIYKLNGKIYALKRYLKIKMTPRDIKDFYREKAILYDLDKYNFPNIVKLYADFEDDETYYLVMEFVEGNTLKSLSTNTNFYLYENQIINIFSQLLKTLQFLHDKCHIMHRDVRPENIILQNNGTIKLLDFGIAVYLENSDPQLVSEKTLKGELHFVPDEMFGIIRNYDYKFDIFSLGFTMYSLMNPSRTVFPNLPQVTYKIEGGFSRKALILQNKNSYSLWLNQLVESLYDKNPYQRPTAERALQQLQMHQNNPNMPQIDNLNIQNGNNINPIFNKQFSGLNPLDNINNNIFTQIPIFNPMSISAQNINNFPNSNVININSNIDYKRLNSYDSRQNNKNTENIFLDEDMGKNNRIMTSMKSLLQVLYRLDKMNDIKDQFYSILMNIQNKNQYFINTFHEMLNNIQLFDSEKINQEIYDKHINDFNNQVFMYNKSDQSGTRPIILFYMISSIFKDEFFRFFNFYKNTIFDDVIKNNFVNLQNIISMYDQETFNSVVNQILSFKNNYKGPFVDNFYFLLLRESRCSDCKNLFGTRIIVANFLQLDIINSKNNITNLIKYHFEAKLVKDNSYCTNCKQIVTKSRKLYCLNSPNYLILELEDKNLVNFDDNINIELIDGNKYTYQFVSGIYKFKNINVCDFVAVIKNGNNISFYHDDILEQCSEEFINLECPSMVIYKKIA